MDKHHRDPQYQSNAEPPRHCVMTVTVNLRPEIEARLAALAAEQGVSLEQYVSGLLEWQATDQPPLSPAERAALWRESVKDLPHTPPLSEDAISRETIYHSRG
jgi:hypothetical protein